MSLLFHKDFSDALTGANGFDSVGAANGTITQSSGAGLNGTSGGVTCSRTANSPDLWGRVIEDFTGKSSMRTAWYTDLSSVTIGTVNHPTRLYVLSDASGANIADLLILRNLSGVFTIEHYVSDDSGSFTINYISLASGYPEWMELWVQRSSGVGVDDADIRLYFGGGAYPDLGELVSTITGIVHYTRFEKDAHFLGMRASGSSVGGSMLIDEWTMRDDDEPILFGVSDSAIARGMKYVLNRRRRKSYCW